MSRMDKLSSYMTTVATDSHGVTHVTYRNTVIVQYGDGFVVLNSGGFETVTTKRKMNQASNQFALGYSVFQKDWRWYVKLPSGDVVDFEDGMRFSLDRVREAV